MTLGGSKRVVVVDDEPDILGLIAFTLREAGWEAHTGATGTQGLELVRSVRPAVVVLDLMLPDVSGIEVCRRLRADPENRLLGIVMVTARGDEYERLLGFESGADDYVVKPFSVRELALRVLALARSTATVDATASAGRELRWRGLLVDPVRHRVCADGTELALRPVEYKILLLLMSDEGRAFTRDEVTVYVWKDAREVSPRRIDTHVCRLREALGTYGAAIETVPGIGYRLAPLSCAT